ncbi:MAG TPA: protein kinase [Bacteroidota bacterium]|nr:protein kinase [Bacteroidota bacterium]
MIGQTISRYKILEKLGEGGMGVVYKAEDIKLDRLVALKFLPPHLSASEQDKSRFIQEAKAASALNHPNVCTIHDIQVFDGQTFIVMEYVDGKTLRESKHGISIKQAVDFVAQVAEGLTAAHEKGIIHRDIKADNIMVRSDGRVQIMDFGLAKLQGPSALTKAGSTIGTTAYMSPGQLQGEEADHRTDIFALGVVMYELLSGQLPFKGAHEAAVMYEIVNVDPQPIQTAKPEVEPDLERIVMKCLEKDRSNRYQSAREVAVDLKRFKRDLEGKRGLSSAAGMQVRSKPTSRSWPRLAIPITVLLVVAAVTWYLLQGRGEAIETLAVLPFANLSADSSMEYLSDGITESLINNLSQLPKLKVMSRSSVFRFKGNATDPQTAGQELGVRAVLLGRVLQRGDNLQVRAELIDASDNTHLWGEQYNRKSADILAVQEEIAKEISQTLRLRLADKDTERLTKRATDNTEAYQLYLKGRYHWNKRSADGLRRGIEYFQQAVDQDPKYAVAYSGMADAYAVLGWFEYGIVPPRDVFPKAKAAARKAIEIDPNRAEPYASLGLISTVYDYDWSSSEQNFSRSIELNPSYASAHQWYSEYLTARGRFEEGVAVMKHALELDPLSLIITRDVGWMLYFARRYDEAIEYFQKALDFDPNFMRAHLILGQTYVHQGNLEKAIPEFEAVSRLSQGSLGAIMLGYCHAKAGRISQAKETLRGLLVVSKTKYVPAAGMAILYAGLGEDDRAFEWLNKALEERSGALAYIKVDPFFDSLRADPRFAQVLKKVGLEE